MHIQQSGSSGAIALFVGIAVFVMASFAYADPPSRVARVGYVSGPVTFSPGGEEDWVAISMNRPLVTGDRLWADAGGRAELQIGNAAIRLGATTSVTLLNLDDRVAQFELAQGTVNVRVRRLDPGHVVEIDTPNLAFVISRPGQYRVSVDSDGDATQVSTSSGQAVVHGQGAAYVVAAGKAYRFVGTDLGDYETVAPHGIDEFDRWAQDRDRGYDSSISARYVSRDVIGYRDLDANGTWSAVQGYGNVWTPSRVSPDWAPYRDGHWAWVDPWGWTWVDDAPWGFAVSHYGRWAHIGGHWGWIPGPVRARAVYAPALVAFIGGANFQVSLSSGNVGAVGWFPLGPRDVYRPAYPVSRAYFTNVNVSNTVINNTNITNVYNNRDAPNVTYVNQQVAGAVVTVPRTAFVQSQPVARAALRVPREAVVRATVTAVAEVAPTQASVHGAAARGAKPPSRVLERRVVATTKPPAAPVGFAAKERVLAAKPGKPLDPAAISALKPDKPVAAPKVEVVAPVRDAKPVTVPPVARAPAAGKAAAPTSSAQPAKPEQPDSGPRAAGDDKRDQKGKSDPKSTRDVPAKDSKPVVAPKVEVVAPVPYAKPVAAPPVARTPATGKASAPAPTPSAQPAKPEQRGSDPRAAGDDKRDPKGKSAPKATKDDPAKGNKPARSDKAAKDDEAAKDDDEKKGSKRP